MKIGILQTGQAPESLRRLGDYPDLFKRLLAGRGFRFETYHVEAGVFPPAVDAADGWLITGSRHGVYEPHPWIAPLESFIREARAAGVPMAGICFGHQIMAQALGGRVEKYSGGWAVGTFTYDFEGEPLTLNAWHQDQVIEPPPEARVLATHPFCRYAALGYGTWGVSLQAHPEFDHAFLAGLIETRGRGVVPEERLQAAKARLGEKLDTDRIAARLAAHFAEAAAKVAD